MFDINLDGKVDALDFIILEELLEEEEQEEDEEEEDSYENHIT